MYFYDGCAILGPGIKDVVASYANNDAMAVIQGNIGVFGCHPEALEWWYVAGDIGESLYSPRHAELMNEFVHKLLAE
jgi:hypothetical protein